MQSCRLLSSMIFRPAALIFLASSTSAFLRPQVTTSASTSTMSTSSPLSVVTDPAPLFVDETRSIVKKYYGSELQTSDDLKTNACCTAGSPPKYIQECIRNLHDTTVAKYYGCGLCLPMYDLTGCKILDLGCGAGRDVYIASQLVGPTGKVVGVDMTVEQLDVAKQYQSYHAEKFGFMNTEFHLGYLESLGELESLEKGSFDIIISNCVINLCTDKPAVLQACYELLKPGGELYFSDVYSNRRVPMSLQKDAVLWGECLSGALYWNDFLSISKQAGFKDPRLVEDAPVTIQNAAVRDSVIRQGHGALEFFSATYRLLKIDALEPACEDYGQAVIYKGTIPNAGSSWTLDKGHVFETGKIHPVCGNTWYMLKENPRVSANFEYIGNFDKHYGIFEGCGMSMPFENNKASGTNNGGKSSKASCC